MLPPEIASLIQQASAAQALDPKLISAFVLQESGGNPWLTRYEPNWRWFYYVDYFAKTNHISSETETRMQMFSWGLLQCMGSVAREMGFTLEMPKLCLPEVSLLYGCRKIKKLSQKYIIQNDLIAAYNAGSVMKEKDGSYTNQHYVDGVNRFLSALNAKVLN